MSWKKFFIFFIVTIVVGTIVFLIINNFYGEEPKNNSEESNSNSNVLKKEKEIIKIDFSKYQELRSEVYNDEVFAIVIMKSDDKVCDSFRQEILYSFKDLKTDIYEIDIDSLDEVSSSAIISDITKLMKYEKPTLIVPTLIVSKKGKIVYIQEGLAYSNEIIDNLNKNEIE